jgi:ribonucleoside-diphosphate reductase alpha subunit
MYGDLDKFIDPVTITQKICSRLYSGMTTTELDTLASQVCMSMIVEHPDYGTLAARIVISNHQKSTSNSFLKVVQDLGGNKDIHGMNAPLVNEELLDIASKYNKEIEAMIDYDRDYLLDYFGFKTLERGYLLRVNDNKEGIIVERPQHTFMRVAIGIHGYDLDSVKRTYDGISLKQFTHATPTLFNAGTMNSQLASCFLSGTEDSIEGLFETISDCAKISKWSGGIGVHISNVRAKGSYIRKTAGKSDGIVPMLKVYNDVARWVNQGGGKRNGSFAMYLEPHHADVFEFLDAKKNTGPDELRARDLFYALWVSDYFMQCVEGNLTWYLMDPDQCKNLNDVYGEKYTTLYKAYVSEGKYVKEIKARQLWEAIISSQIEHGLPYICYKDAANLKSNHQNIGTIKSSNLCAEVLIYSDNKEYGTCNLASICLPSILEFPTFSDDHDNEWSNLLSKEEKELKELFQYGDLQIFTKEDCVYCKLLISLLDKINVFYQKIDKDKAIELWKLANPHDDDEEVFKTAPQLFSTFGTKTHVFGGYTECWKFLKPKINFSKLEKIAYEVTLNLNKVIDRNYYPTEKAKISNIKHRPIGLGVQGLHDVFMMLKIPFTSDEARKFNKEIFETIYHGSMRASIDLAEIHGPYSTYANSPLSKGMFQFNLWGLKDEDLSGRWNWNTLREKMTDFGTRNSLNIALMPTASTSSIFGNVESFEVLTSNLYTRNVLSGTFTLINKHLVKDLIDMNLWTEEMKDKLIFYKGSVQQIKEIPKFMKEIYKTAFEVDQKMIIKMSAERGIFVCQSQSLNLFFENPTFKELTSCHFFGWKNGLKTGSYYIRTKPALNAQSFGLSVEKELKIKSENLNHNDNESCLSCGA